MEAADDCACVYSVTSAGQDLGLVTSYTTKAGASVAQRPESPVTGICGFSGALK